MNKKNHMIRFKSWICKPIFSKYIANGSLCIRLVDHITNEPIATVTVYLSTSPPKGCIWIKNYSENRGMIIALIKAGVIYSIPSTTIKSGYEDIGAYKLTKKFKMMYEL